MTHSQWYPAMILPYRSEAKPRQGERVVLRTECKPLLPMTNRDTPSRDTTPSDRGVKWIFEELARQGRTQTELAELLGVQRAQVSRLKNGQRRLYADELIKVRRWFGLEAVQDRPTVPIVAKVGAGGNVIYHETEGEQLERADVPAGLPEEAIALRVTGTSMRTRYPDGRIIVGWRKVTDPTAYVGEDCVVRLADGRTLLKTVAFDRTPGRWRLESTDDEPIEGADVEWIMPVEIVLRRATIAR